MSDECVLDDGEGVTAELDGRQMWCLFFALVVPSVVWGLLDVCLDFWALGSTQFVTSHYSVDVVSVADVGPKAIVGVWIEKQVIYTAVDSLFIAVLGLPLFLFGLCWYERGASIRGFMFGVVAGVALLALLLILGQYEPSKNDKHSANFIKYIFLNFITFATSGMWIAWQAWRAAHAEEKFWPQFSLATLLIGVMSCGALLGMFAPE